MANYVSLENLEVYKLARRLSVLGWEIYGSLELSTKRIMGDQFIRSTDSIGANIAEGYGRFHFLDKVRFYYNARGSLIESMHWFDLVEERIGLDKIYKTNYLQIYKEIRLALNGLIKSTMKAKNNS